MLAGAQAAHARPTRVSSCGTVTLGPHLARLPEELRDEFIDAVIGRDGRAARPSTTCGSTSRRGARRRPADEPGSSCSPGDGIGPEIGAAATKLLDELGGVEIDEHLIGGASIDAHGTALTDEVLEACRSSDAVLLCAVGGPKWDTTDPDAPAARAGAARPAQGPGALRQPAPGQAAARRCSTRAR